MGDKCLIVGLGNPGGEYEYTRHNLGFLVVGALAKRWHIRLSRQLKLKSRVGTGTIADKEIVLATPLTYMNNSGVAVSRIIKEKDIALSQLLVVCDDLNLPFGRLRIRAGGSAGGHHGLESIIHCLYTRDFGRLRIGIGPVHGDAVDFVLADFTKKEKQQLPAVIDKAVECCEVWAEKGIASSMNQFNRRKDDEQV